MPADPQVLEISKKLTSTATSILIPAIVIIGVIGCILIYLRAKVKKVFDKFMRRKFAKGKTSQSDQCPKCGGNLVKRTGKFGEFFGCSNYPRCKYTVNK